MNEREIAEKKVIPYLKSLGWPDQLITQYGKVPVKMGTQTKWADIVTMFVDENEATVPYLVVEVKTAFSDMKAILAQTDSYSKLLDAPFFIATDGNEYFCYQRIPAGGYIRVNSVPVPDTVHLTVNKNTKFKPGYLLRKGIPIGKAAIPHQYEKLTATIDSYFDLMSGEKHYMGLSGSYSLRSDITSHFKDIKWMNSLIHEEIETLTPGEFREEFEECIMCYRAVNKKHIFSEVDRDFSRVVSFLRFVKEFPGDAEENLEALFDTANDLHIKGMGPFVISQFLACAHPREYTIIEDRMVNTMKDLSVIDTKVQSDTPRGYLYANEICKKLYADLFSKKIAENKNRLGFKTDDDFSLIVIHEFFWEYDEFGSFDPAKLKEASGDERKREEAKTDINVAKFESLMGAW